MLDKNLMIQIGKNKTLTELFIVIPRIEITSDFYSLMAFVKQKFSNRSIILVLEELCYKVLYKNHDLIKCVERIVPFTEEIITSGREVIIFQNSNYDKIKKDMKEGVLKDKIAKLFLPDAAFITESNIFRNEKPNYFTFSPFQDTQPFFSRLKDGSSIKKQLCVRYVNKGDLTNPLFMSVHNCYAYQCYLHANQCEKISYVIDVLSDAYLIEKNRIVVRYHKKCEEYMKSLQDKYKTAICDDDNYIAHLNISGAHFYVQALYKHENGLLSFVNFVLVDFKNELSQLDSIIYQDRLELINENKTYIMQVERYKSLVDEVIRNQPHLSDQELHEVTNHYITIFYLMFMHIRGSNKGVGNELKRKIKALVVFVKYYLPLYNPLKNLESVAEEVKKLYGFKSDREEIVADFRNMYSAVSEVMEKNIRNIPKLREVYSLEELSATFGIPKEEFGYRHENSIYQYPFGGKTC